MTTNNQNKKFRILSLDGGGVRGSLSAKILVNVENTLNHINNDEKPLGQRFELIAGTSTGAIIALALASGASAAEIDQFYNDYMQSIFGNPRYKVTNLFKPKYDSKPLKDVLDQFSYFKDDDGKKTLGTVNTHVCIPTVALASATLRLYKSDYLSRNQGRINEKLVDVAYASSAAPTFFPPQTDIEKSGTLIDGGLCANNPSVIAIIDALQFEPNRLWDNNPSNEIENIAMLSVGTGKPCGLPFHMKKVQTKGLIGWANPVIELMMQSQSSMADSQAKFLLKANHYHRINPQLRFSMKLDEIDKIHELKNHADIDTDAHTFITEYIL